MQQVLNLPEVETVLGDRCQYGQESKDGEPVRKCTRWMSNSTCILRALSKRCYGRGGACSRRKGGRHREVSGAEIKRSQEYPFELCKAILLGCRRQLVEDGRLVLGVAGVQRYEERMTDKQLEAAVRRVVDFEEDRTEREDLVELNSAEQQTEFRDALTGQVLVPELV